MASLSKRLHCGKSWGEENCLFKAQFGLWISFFFFFFWFTLVLGEVRKGAGLSPLIKNIFFLSLSGRNNTNGFSISAPGPFEELVSQWPPAFFEEQEATKFKYIYILTKHKASVHTGTTHTHTRAHMGTQPILLGLLFLTETDRYAGYAHRGFPESRLLSPRPLESS